MGCVTIVGLLLRASAVVSSLAIHAGPLNPTTTVVPAAGRRFAGGPVTVDLDDTDWLNVPDRARAEAAWEKFGELIRQGGHVALDPDAEGDVHFPLDYAPRPTSIARSLFSPEVIDRHLDALAGRQDADGGWRFAFPAWTPVTRFDWGGWVTLESLLVLRDNGRL